MSRARSESGDSSWHLGKDAEADALLDDGGKCDECERRIFGTPVRKDSKNLCKPCAQKIDELEKGKEK